MIRAFPLVAVFAVLATLCLSTTSAIPVAKREATSTAECVQEHWDLVRELLSKLTEDQKGCVPELFMGDEPITTAPSVDNIEAGLDKLEEYDSVDFDDFLTFVKCNNNV
ncbi:hypothetical protein EC957_000073 [Mortierella hygrophila]|uniref:Uncharacterized protein n=1 Tax=Mortierella hygrophila TaxID=979708 RepID=A0A9P6K923_9FUNG|nr:hypothetical protein EC957_000058 [Mortierella hygrophila]KAF9552000.1 hypothetical protein EC957_000073 [Mortierella hygrophila]